MVAEKIHKHSMLIVNKNSPMTPMLNQALARMRQSGLPDLILEHHMKRYL